jgi:hypothetical protein
MNLRSIGPKFPLRNLMAALAVLAVTMASVRGLEPTYKPPLMDNTHFLLQVATRIGLDGRVAELTGREWETAFQRMTSPAVLETALADPWLSSLPRLRKAADPRAELRRMIQFRSVDARVHGLVRLSVASPTEPVRAASVVARAIVARGPPRISIIPRVYRWGPLDRPWKVAAAWVFGLLAALLILLRPSRESRRETSDDRGSGRGQTSAESRADRIPDGARPAIAVE